MRIYFGGKSRLAKGFRGYIAIEKPVVNENKIKQKQSELDKNILENIYWNIQIWTTDPQGKLIKTVYTSLYKINGILKKEEYLNYAIFSGYRIIANNFTFVIMIIP